MKPVEKYHIFSNMAKYVRSGMGIDVACDSLLEQTRKADERRIYESLKSGVQNGQSIADAMSQAKVINHLDYEMLDAAEKGGRLETGFEHLAQYYERVNQARRKIRKGLIYPCVLFHLALIVTSLVSAVFLSANFSGENVSYSQALWQSGRWALLIYLIIVIAVAAIWYLIKQSNKSAGADRLINRLPLIGKARRFAALERFCSVFQLFLLSGQKMDISLDRAAKASDSAQILSDCQSGIKNIQAGEKLAPVFLEHSSSFPNDFARGIAAAEESGMLDLEFERWRKFYSESFAEAMDQVAVWFPKIVYFGALVLGAIMIIKVGMSYVQMLDGILP